MAKSKWFGSGSLSQATRQEVRGYLSMARELADPAAESGDLRGSYEIWACTIRLLLATIGEAQALKDGFTEVLKLSAAMVTPKDRVEAIRTAVSPFLDVSATARHVTIGRNQPLHYIRQNLDLAIQIGAPSYNAGDHRGCYEVYACTARLMLLVPGAEGAKRRLDRALRDCLEMNDPDAQAWAMRHGFDDVLAGTFGPPITDASRTIRNQIIRAIQVGAPTYNAGDHQGCYDIYARTANRIVQTAKGSPESKQALCEALQECQQEDSVTERAWIMRRVFDRILAG